MLTMFNIVLSGSLIICYVSLIYASVHEETIFDYDYCEMKCGKIVHTMCVDENFKPQCQPFEYFHFSKNAYNVTLLQVLVNGHNGLRSRIAERMKVTNMLELAWDRKLARMARNFLFHCGNYETDPCTMTPDIVFETDIMPEFYKVNKTSPQISQNIYREKTNFYPYKFLEHMIQDWYFEKEIMEMPTYERTDTGSVGRLLGENNFTHFAFPLSYRFGCAMAKFKGFFHAVCNYYPHFRTVTNSLLFSSGVPASDCPSRFPLRDDMYSNLCTNDAESYFDSADERRPSKTLNIFFIILVLGTNFTNF